MREENFDVSIITPIYNGEHWIERCFNSIVNQSACDELKLEISICNDASTDNTQNLLQEWKRIFEAKEMHVTIVENDGGSPKGVGYAKNQAVKASSGRYLCFQDIDDVMLPNRIRLQYEAANRHKDSIVGCKFTRDPPESTVRYTKWANDLRQDLLDVQVYTSHGPTVIMPTWFMHRDVFDRVGGFSEEGRGFPEDLLFFFDHLDRGGKIYRVDECLLIYSYHLNATTFSVSSESIWNIRLEKLIKIFFPLCQNGFTIWNAGKQGKKFFKSLNEQQQSLVKCFCDVDPQKCGTSYEMYSDSQRKVIARIPIIHFSQATPPIIICIKMDMTDGEFEENLSSLNLTEGKDYVLFS